MTYSLRRTRDGAGDSGPLSQAVRFNEETEKVEYGEGVRPRMGYSMQVGALGARTYSAQDYWVTTPITEILVNKPDYVRFKTGNSEYEWKEF